MTAQPRVHDYIVLPGEVLESILDGREITKSEFAERCGRSAKFVSEIVSGKAVITEETALQFARVLDTEAVFWTNLESSYRLRLARIEEERRFSEMASYAKRFPLKQLAAGGWIGSAKAGAVAVGELLGFFGVATVEAMEGIVKRQSESVAFRRSPSFQGKPEAVMTWLRCGEVVAERKDLPEYDVSEFRACLKEIREMTLAPPANLPEALASTCARAGVAVVCVPELPGCRLSGATRWYRDRPLIQLSLRHKSDDHVWFTFFHEAGHVLLHGKKGVFVEDCKDDPADPKEIEANQFAANILIPRAEMDGFIARGRFDEGTVVEFAERSGIAPGIVVGRLQHAGLVPFGSALTKLKTRLDWPG